MPKKRKIPILSYAKTHILLTKFEAERERRHRELSSLLSQLNKDNVVLVMMVNHGYIDFFRNWVCSCDNRNIEVRSWTLVFTVDAEASECVKQLGFVCYTDPVSYGSPSKEAVKVFGDMQFRALMFQKTAIVKDVLDLGYKLLFQDVDVVWMKDPKPYFLHPSNAYLDARFMYDGRNKLHAPLHVNSGFFWLNPTPESIRFWSEVLRNYGSILAFGSQQRVVNAILAEYVIKGLRFNMLLEKDFANGHLFTHNKTEKLPKDPYVIHCSWTGNPPEKKRKYKSAGLWYLNTPNAAQSKDDGPKNND